MKPIQYCLNKQLQIICQHSVELEVLSKKVIQRLPEELRPYCHVGSWNKGCLTLVTEDAAFATQLRFFLPILRDVLRKEEQLFQLTNIKLIIQEQSPVTKSAQKEPAPLSESSKANIIAESRSCSYTPLKEALLHLTGGE
jgi:hypothetical protein